MSAFDGRSRFAPDFGFCFGRAADFNFAASRPDLAPDVAPDVAPDFAPDFARAFCCFARFFAAIGSTPELYNSKCTLQIRRDRELRRISTKNFRRRTREVSHGGTELTETKSFNRIAARAEEQEQEEEEEEEEED
jgi:hypothetical protein